MSETTLTIFNTSVCLQTSNKHILKAIEDFLSLYYTTITQGRGEEEDKEKVYAGIIKSQNAYFLFRRQFSQFYRYLKDNLGIDIRKDAEVINYTEYEVEEGLYKANPKFVLKEEQVPVFNFILENRGGTCLIPLATGVGKTVVSLLALAEINQRFAMVILPTFIPKWIEDIQEIHQCKEEDILAVQGSNDLRKLIVLGKKGENPYKYIILSNRTMDNFYKAYEEDPEVCEDMYGCTPTELFALLKIGTLLVDEAHLSFHSIFRSIIYSNAKDHIALTATLITDDKILETVHRTTYTADRTYGQTLQKRYIDVYPVHVGITQESLPRIRTGFYGSPTYSHTALEQSLLSNKNKSLRANFLSLIKSLVEDFYLDEYQKDDKLLIFVATVAMASKLVEFLSYTYPDKIVKRYCQEDSYEENLMKGEIVVSTVLSAGTGVDISNLRVVIQTVSISSSTSNIQSLGRLRYLKDRDVKFIYTYSKRIPKQVAYHKKRVELFLPRTRNIINMSARVDL